MITIDIPGTGLMQISNLVLDYNGTLAIDGTHINGVEERLNRLAEELTVYVVTADTFGKAAVNLKNTNCNLTILGKGNQQQQKAGFIKKLGAQQVAAIGNGLNDALMLETAALGIAVVQQEGAAVKTLQKADIVFNNINDALDLLQNPLRLKATLRV